MTIQHTFKAALLALAALLLPAAAQSAAGFATANVNMRSGPSTAYPAVTVIPIGTSVEIHGCLSEVPWCDVSFYEGRGWVASRYVQVEYQESLVYLEPYYYDTLGIPFVTFEIGNYWDRYYRDRDFYRDRNYYRDRYRNGDYYRRDTDGNRAQRDRRIRRDYERFDRARDDDGSSIERSRRDRIERRDREGDRVRAEAQRREEVREAARERTIRERRSRGDDGNVERPRRDRDRIRAERQRREDVREFRDTRGRDRDRPRVERRDRDRDQIRGRDNRRRCRPADDNCN